MRERGGVRTGRPGVLGAPVGAAIAIAAMRVDGLVVAGAAAVVAVVLGVVFRAGPRCDGDTNRRDERSDGASGAVVAARLREPALTVRARCARRRSRRAGKPGCRARAGSGLCEPARPGRVNGPGVRPAVAVDERLREIDFGDVGGAGFDESPVALQNDLLANPTTVRFRRRDLR